MGLHPPVLGRRYELSTQHSWKLDREILFDQIGNVDTQMCIDRTGGSLWRGGVVWQYQPCS